MKSKLLFGIFLFGLTSLKAQVNLLGKVVNSEDQQPIEAVHIFIANTTIGTFTDAQGNYQLRGVPIGKQQIIVSHLSYETQYKLLQIKAGPDVQLKIPLQPLAKELTTVEVSASKDRKWRRDLKRFSDAFFGQSLNANRCEIINPTVLNFSTDKEGRLLAQASDLLEVENRALGYRLYFLLLHFAKKGEEISYAGKPYFVPLEPRHEKEAHRWSKARERAYLGSSRHFFQALSQKRLKNEGFALQNARLNVKGDFEILGSPNLKKILLKGERPEENYLVLDDFLRIVYEREQDKITPTLGGIGSVSNLGHPTEQNVTNDGTRDSKGNSQNQVSYLFARSAKIPIDTSGVLLQPELLIEYGYWHYERVADMLPREYQPNHDNKSLMTPLAPQRKGFVLERLLLPLEEIQDGGPPKDGIPSIDYPRFLAAEEADFLNDEELVLGLHYNGISTAYPIRILNYHEVVNDKFGDQPVAITYCPLCRSGVAFLAGTPEAPKVFGVSGLLYNSDVLLYDRTTESLWSQLLGKAISGPLSGQEISFLPLTQTSWKEWKKRYPETMVLSTNTGHQRDYNSSPYEQYEKEDRLLFSVAHENKSLPPKALVLGISVDGKHKAYPLNRLRKKAKDGPLQDQFNGQALYLHYDEDSHSAWASDAEDKAIPATTLYWFAWYAFHPQTAIF